MTKYQQICLKYFGGKIQLTEALEKIQALPIPWNTEEWKEKKKLILKNNCEACGTNEDLQIQHYWHPTKINVLKREATYFLLDKEIKNYKIDKDDFAKYIRKFIYTVNGCQDCTRKISKGGRCPNCKKKIPSDQIIEYFKIPGHTNMNIKNPIDSKRLSTMENFYRKSKYSEIKKDIWESRRGQINDFVFRQSYLENLRYLSFVDVKTACKKCSANEDYNYIQYKSLIADLKAGK